MCKNRRYNLFVSGVFVVLLSVSAFGQAGLVGTWAAQGEGYQVQVVLSPDGAFTRNMTGPSGREFTRGRYSVQGQVLTVQPEGGEAIRFSFTFTFAGSLLLRGADGQEQLLVRQGAEPPPQPAPTAQPAPLAQPTPHAQPATPARPAQQFSPSTSASGDSLVPAWVRPGLRLTYYIMTGSLPGSVNGYVPDEEGNWVDGRGNRYSNERKGHSSHGLVQATVAGMDNQTVALSEPFYLYNGQDTTPVLNTSLDMLVTADTGGDFWMHPRRQAQYRQQYPWGRGTQPGQTLARSVQWTEAGQTFQATAIAIIGEASRTLYYYDQASGRLLYLSRLTRNAPDVRDPNQTMPDTVSYSTFLRFVGVRQLDLPWLDSPLPESVSRAQSFSYRGSFSLQGPGMTPTPLQIAIDLQVAKRGANWQSLRGRSQTQGTVGVNEVNSVNGPGNLPPLGIAPSVLASLQVGQEIDRDPHTGFVVRVSASDAQAVVLQAVGPRQTYTYVFDRQRGILVRRVSQERNPATPEMVSVRDLQLANVQ